MEAHHYKVIRFMAKTSVTAMAIASILIVLTYIY